MRPAHSRFRPRRGQALRIGSQRLRPRGETRATPKSPSVTVTDFLRWLRGACGHWQCLAASESARCDTSAVSSSRFVEEPAPPAQVLDTWSRRRAKKEARLLRIARWMKGTVLESEATVEALQALIEPEIASPSKAT